MLKRTICAVLPWFTVTLPSLALAHPGHGVTESNSPLHYLTDHPLAVVALAALAGATTVLTARRLRRRRGPLGAAVRR